MVGMQKSKILIASSSRTGVLAEKLRDQLDTNYSVADLWKDAIKGKPADTTIEMLEEATERYDFAVIVLDETGVNVNMVGDPLKDRDNRFFEAGLYIAAFGRDSCFIINSAERPYLPSDLDGIRTLHFIEPEPGKLNDRDACAEAIRAVSSQIREGVEPGKRVKNRPLSRKTLLEREKLQPEGELVEDQIVATITQPFEINYTAAFQIRENLDHGIGYAFYFHGYPAGVQRICQLFQLVLLAPMLANPQEAEFGCRLRRLLEPATKAQIIKDLKLICEHQLLKIYLLQDPPELQYIIHNANSEAEAALYLKHKENKFIELERGEKAYRIWTGLEKSLGHCDIPSNAIFCGTSGFEMKEDFYKTLKIGIKKSFPDIDGEVVELCCAG
jgi:hypothetical protein